MTPTRLERITFRSGVERATNYAKEPTLSDAPSSEDGYVNGGRLAELKVQNYTQSLKEKETCWRVTPTTDKSIRPTTNSHLAR